jgi:MFS family permease
MKGKRWLVLAFVFLGIVVSYIDRGNLSVAIASIADELHFVPSTMGLLLSAFFWTYAVFQIPAGSIVDRFGVRGAYAGAFVVWSLASASIALSRGSGDIFASRLVLGLAETVGPIASLAAIRASFAEKENGLPTSIYIAGQQFGPSLSLLVGSTLLVHFGWRAMFAVTGLTALIWVPAWIKVAPVVEKKTGKEPPFDWSTLLESPTLWAMAGFILLSSYYWYFVLTWVPDYLMASRGFSTMGMGKILSAALACMAVVSILGGFLADVLVKKSQSLFGVRVWFAAAGSVGAASLVLLNVLPGNGVGMVVMFVSMCSFGIVSSNFWTLAQNVAPRTKVARVIGFLNTASQVAGIAAPWITGYIIGPAKHFAPAVAIAGVCPLVSLVPLFMASRGMERLRTELGQV